MEEELNKFMLAASSYEIAHNKPVTTEEAFRAGYKAARGIPHYVELVNNAADRIKELEEALHGLEAFAKMAITRIDHGDIIFSFNDVPLTVTALKKVLTALK